MFSFLKRTPQAEPEHTEDIKPLITVNPVVKMSDPEPPEFQGDYAKAVFLWANGKKAPIKNEDQYARYILFECGIRQPQEYHERMIVEGYLAEDSIADILMARTGVQLKEMASALGLAVSGKKEVLVERILSVADSNYVYQNCPATFSLTEKGKAFLEEHDAYVQLHRNNVWGISWQEYDASHNSSESFYDTMWRIFSERAAKDKRLFGRIEYFNMHQLAIAQGDEHKAFQLLSQVLYLDVSGVSGMESYNYCRKGVFSKQDLLKWYQSNIMIAPGIIDLIYKYRSSFNNSIIEKLYSWKLPVQICDKALFTELMQAAMSGNMNYDYFNSKLEKEYAKYISSL